MHSISIWRNVCFDGIKVLFNVSFSALHTAGYKNKSNHNNISRNNSSGRPVTDK